MIRVKLDNPRILAWAREDLGLTLEEVAKRFGRDRTVIDAWEKGDEAPTFRQLMELANYYKRPVAAFFLPSVPPGTPKPADHRTLPYAAPGEYSKQTLLAYREVFNNVGEARELIDQLGDDIHFSLPVWDMDESPEQKAAELRSLIGISIEQQMKGFQNHSVALEAWRSALFDLGVLVRICRMPIADARAFCLFGDRLAAIGLSNEDREHGRIFSLFHEACHLSLKQPGVSGLESNYQSPNQMLEQYCDRFSASFLLPSAHSEVLDSLGLFQGTTDRLETGRFLADKFKVSKYVALRRALDLDLISPNVYWDTIEEWKRVDAAYSAKARAKGKAGGDYHRTQINYVGRRFVALVMEAMQKSYLTPVDVRRIIGLDAAAVEATL